MAPSPANPQTRRRFGAFDGVFTPTVLTILGVIMYLREGWVVGELGLAGAWAVILIALSITIFTALSLSSIATNVQLDEGGAFAIIRRSLGLELGASVGMPQYITQALAVAMYIFGLREGWLAIFPDHSAIVVDFAAFAVIFGLAFVSTSLALRVQFIVMALIVASLVSAAMGLALRDAPMQPIVWWNVGAEGFGSAHFWSVFAVFFPATTGILAGANMSGELRNPRRSIPIGTLGAVFVGTAVYLGLAYWFARVATPEELRTNYRVMIERSAWAPAVLAGLLGATFSSALSSLVGAPRILSALAASGAIPRAGWLASRGEEPHRAMLVTGVIVGLALLMRDLNTIAPLITLFFLITYATINVVVLLEQRLAVVSFRPRFRLPIIVPLAGTAGCVFAMFIVNPAFSLVAVAVVIIGYGLMMRRKLASDDDDVRSGLFLMLAEWAARRSSGLPRGQSRAWKANLLVPVVDIDELLGNFELIVDLTKPYGGITLLGITKPGERNRLLPDLEQVADDFTHRGVHCTATALEAVRVDVAILHAMQTLRSAFMRPNLLFLTPLATALSDDGVLNPTRLERPMRAASENGMGVVLAALHPKSALGRKQLIHVWIREQSPEWRLDEGLQRGNLNLQVLIAYLVESRWDAELTFHCVAPNAQESAAEAYLTELIERSRMPDATKSRVHVGCSLEEAIRAAGHADLNIFGLSEEAEMHFVGEMVEATHTGCLFLRDSGEEDALA